MTVYELAHECLENNDWDWQAAAEEMESKIWQDQQLRDELMKPLIGQAVWNAIKIQAGAHRQAFKAGRSKVAEKAKDNPNGIRRVVERSWYEYPIFGGKKLGDATPSDLDAAAESYQRLADSNKYEAERMRRIRAVLKEEKPVREQLTEEQISSMMES